jgi:putative PIN family toxin of toxin-antitoxin system
MAKVVLDTNVVLSAILFGGKPRQILEAAIGGTIKICISGQTIAELERVLHRPRFGFNSQMVQTIISEITAIAEWVEPHIHRQLVVNDPGDNMFLDCAIEGKVDYLVSGDHHLLSIGNCKGMQIINPDGFIEILAREKT